MKKFKLLALPIIIICVLFFASVCFGTDRFQYPVEEVKKWVVIAGPVPGTLFGFNGCKSGNMDVVAFTVIHSTNENMFVHTYYSMEAQLVFISTIDQILGTVTLYCVEGAKIFEVTQKQ